MSFPVNLDASTPANTESPSLGASRIRAIIQNLIDLFGLPSSTNLTGALMSAGALTDGKLATAPVLKAASPFRRFIGTEGSAKDVRLLEDGGLLKLQVNTGSEGTPTWVTVYSWAWTANFAGSFTHGNTADRIYTLPDRAITVAGIDDLGSLPTLTNRTGGTLAAGDCVTVDTATATSVVLSDVVGSLVPILVSLDAPANTATGRFQQSGKATALVGGAVTIGNYLRKSATTKALEDTGTPRSSTVRPPAGSCAVALQATAGPGPVTLTVELLGVTFPDTTAAVYTDSFTGLVAVKTSNTAVTVALGAAASDDAAIATRVLISLTAAMQGNTNGTWVVGSNQNKLDTGTIGNNQTWHVFVIQRPDTGVVDIAFSQSATTLGASVPAAYTKKQRVATFLTDGSANIRDVITYQNVFATEFVSLDQTVTVSSTLNVAHGLGAKPKLVQVTLKNATTESGYAVDDEVPITGLAQAATIGTNVVFDATNVSIITQTAVRMYDRSTRTEFNITPANWKYVVRAWK